MSGLSKSMTVLAWLSLPALALAYALIAKPYMKRPAIEYVSARPSDPQMGGSSGDWTSIHLAWRLKRSSCIIEVNSLSIFLIASDGLAYTVGGNRGGMPVSYEGSGGVIDLTFQVPEKVPSGRATLVFSNSFQCGNFSTEPSRARYTFEVSGDG